MYQQFALNRNRLWERKKRKWYLCWFWVSQMIHTEPDVDSAQLIPAASEKGQQPSPNSLYCSTSCRRLWADAQLNNTITDDEPLQTTDYTGNLTTVSVSVKSAFSQKHISCSKTYQPAKNKSVNQKHFWSNSQSVLLEKMGGRGKVGIFRASRVLLDKRKVEVCICISILISFSQIKNRDTMADRVDLLPALFLFFIGFSLYCSVVP